MILKGGDWSLLARVDGDIRTFRIARILTLGSVDERFERPADFNLAAHWQAWSRRFESESYRAEATVRLGPRARELARYVAAPAVRRAFVATEEPPDADGWIVATVPIESFDHTIGDFLKLGAEVEVLAPSELRGRLAETVRTLARRYADA